MTICRMNLLRAHEIDFYSKFFGSKHEKETTSTRTIFWMACQAYYSWLRVTFDCCRFEWRKSNNSKDHIEKKRTTRMVELIARTNWFPISRSAYIISNVSSNIFSLTILVQSFAIKVQTRNGKKKKGEKMWVTEQNGTKSYLELIYLPGGSELVVENIFVASSHWILNMEYAHENHFSFTSF